MNSLSFKKLIFSESRNRFLRQINCSSDMLYSCDLHEMMRYFYSKGARNHDPEIVDICEKIRKTNILIQEKYYDKLYTDFDWNTNWIRNGQPLYINGEIDE